MTRRKPIVLLIIAAVLGLLATTATARFLEKHGGLGSGGGSMVLAAAENLSPGMCITEDVIRKINWPGDSIPESLITEYKDVLGLYVSSPLASGEPLVRNKLSEDSLTGKIAGRVPKGYRAMAIEVDRAVKAGGLLEAGSFVDVLTVVSERGRPPVSKIILQNIKVLSVGVRKTDPEEEGNDEGSASRPGSEEAVTLLLLPEEAEKLALATTKGKIRVMARGTADTDTVDTTGFTLGALLPAREGPKKVDNAPPAPEPEAEDPRYTAESLFNTAKTLEAKGELDNARKLFEQMAKEFCDHKLAAEAIRRSGSIADGIEKKLKLAEAARKLASAQELLHKGLFDDCRDNARSILEEFGSLTYRGEKISDIVTGIKLKANTSEKRARIDFQLFSNLLKNGSRARAEVHLKKMARDYPESSYYHKAVGMAAEADAAREENILSAEADEN